VSTNIKMTSHVKEAMQSLQDNAVKRMDEAVNEVRNNTLKKLSGNRTGRQYKVPGTSRTYTASAPGEPPAQRLGELRQSIKSVIETKGKKIIGSVGTDKVQGLMTEFGTKNMAPRPWLKPSFDESKDKIISIFNRHMEL